MDTAREMKARLVCLSAMAAFCSDSGGGVDAVFVLGGAFSLGDYRLRLFGVNCFLSLSSLS